MKKFIYSLMAAVMTCLVSCSDLGEVSQYYPLNVAINLPGDKKIDEITSGSITVTNTQTGREFKFENIEAAYGFNVPGGIYDIQVQFRSNNGTETSMFNGAKLSQPIFDDTKVAIDLEQGVTSGLVFKEIYYNMVRPNGKTPYMADQFMEVYNNSDEVLYLDNCIIGILEGQQGMLPSVWVDENGELLNKYPMGYYTIAFVGDGKQHPINPGQSVVIASQAQDHTAITEKMYVEGTSGAKISPVNLTNANYEVCLTEYKPNVAIDNPLVPNMDIIDAYLKQNYFMVPYVGNAVILAKLPCDPYEFVADKTNYMAKPGSSSGAPYLMIPQEYVLDGVNIVNNADKENQQVIRLRSEVDAGKVFNEAAYCGLSIRRKVVSIENGRAVLSDTNNSTNDFLRNQVPTPGVIPTTVD